VKKQRFSFIHTFSFILSILILLVVFNINKNIPLIDELKTKYNNEVIAEDFNTEASEDIAMDDSDGVSDNLPDDDSEENVVTLAGKKNYTIVIDPGHGGPDPGSSGKNGTLEKDVVLQVALKLGPILEKKGFKVIYTRKTDKIEWSGQKEELLQRAAISNNAKADLFVSIHTNASELTNIKGVETYYNRLSSKGKRAASLVQNEVVKQINLKNRGIRSENYSVLRNVNAPSILVELAYISTPAEEAILKNPQSQLRFAQGIANGVVKYFEN
jgi:N-acetylmuramoyl-L-alanine amidase